MDGDYTDINSGAIDKLVENGWEWSIPTSHEDFLKAKAGDWSVDLTPIKSVPVEWFVPYYTNGRLDGVGLLGLACGGGQQMPVFAALGAACTVLDYSVRQLEQDRMMSEREGYGIELIRADMTKRLPFEDNSFDIIFHPVSNSFVEDVYHVWNECFRVLKPGGILMAGMDNGINYLCEADEPLKVVNRLPYNPLKNPEQYRKCMEGGGCLEFSHTLEEQIGGQLKAGLRLTDLYEDRDRTDVIGEYYPQFIATRAVKS